MIEELYDIIPNNWGATLQQLRQDTGISQCELAERSGVCQCHISYIETEKRNPTVGVMEALLNSMGHTICICEKE